MQLVVDTLAEVWFTIVVLHDIQTFVDGFLVLQREYHPTTQHTTTHRRHRMVDDIQQRLTIVLHRSYQFQRTDGKLVKTHIALFLYSRDAGDMGYLRVQRLFQILQDGTSSNDTTLQVVNAKALQRLHIEVLEEFLMCCLLCKHPVVKFKGHQTIAKVTLEVVLSAPIV